MLRLTKYEEEFLSQQKSLEEAQHLESTLSAKSIFHCCCCQSLLLPWLCPLQDNELISEIQCSLLDSYLVSCLNSVFSKFPILAWPFDYLMSHAVIYSSQTASHFPRFSASAFDVSLYWDLHSVRIMNNSPKLLILAVPGSLPCDCPTCSSSVIFNLSMPKWGFVKMPKLEL